MSETTLVKFEFSEARLDAVQDFYCGEEPWERPVADWIKSPNGAVAELQKNRSLIGCWLYASQRDGLVGYAALSESKWPYPEEISERVRHLHVLWCGIRKQVQGHPKDVPQDERYSYQIMKGLQAEVEKRNLPRVLSLYVDVENKRAIHFYENYGFQWVPHKIWEENGRYFKGMALKF